MSRTAWSQTSRVPSDRTPPSQAVRNKGKGKINELPKSKEVRKLEGLVESLKLPPSGKDPRGGCFCQARVHRLSAYTPLCMQCGLVLCLNNAPHYSCPHCASPLLNSSSRDALVQRLSAEISEVVIREQEDQEREKRERQEAIGAFPSLATSTGTPQRSTMNRQPHKVLSLNSKTRKVTVASYHTISAKAEETEPVEELIPPPPKDVDFVKSMGIERGRWANLRGERIYYVPSSDSNTAQGPGGSRRQKKKVTGKN